MYDDVYPAWLRILDRMRLALGLPLPARALKNIKQPIPPPSPAKDAIMTLLAIMKEEDDPRMQIAAAKALLAKEAKNVSPAMMTENNPLPESLSADDIDAAIAAAKAILDELAARKAGSMAGAGAMADRGASGTDNAAR